MTRKPPGYWDDWNNVEAALLPVITRLGRFPTASEIRAFPGGSSISDEIVKAGGYQKIAEQMDAKRGSSQRPMHYWRSWENVVQELGQIMLELGRVPSRREMEERRLSSLHQAIVDYHGGITAVCRRLGVKPHQQPNGYWKKWENIESALNRLVERLARFPKSGELNEITARFSVQSIAIMAVS